MRITTQEAKLEWLSLEAQPLNHRRELEQKIFLFTPRLISNSLNDYKFQQAETLMELHSFTFITIDLYSF
jgi:hypothetical protein